MTTTLSTAAQEFFNTEEGKQVILPATAGVDYVYIDVVDFSDQQVDNLFSDKYVAVYIIKDVAPVTDKQLYDMYHQKGLYSTLFYPEHIREKLAEKFGKLKLYVSKINGTTCSSFDYDSLTDSDKEDYTDYEETTNYFANTVEALNKMWEPLTKQEIEELTEYATKIVDDNIPKLYQVETSVERPYAVNVFNDSVSSFMSTHATYEECLAVLERIHSDKVKTLTSEMAYV